jgi:hypothetical protein
MALRRHRVDEEERMLRLAQFRLAGRLAREDLNELAQRLDDCPPWLDGDAATEWKLAAGEYAGARAGLRDAHSLGDVLRVHTVLRDAWFHLARSDAFALDEPPPSSPEPFALDPRRLRPVELNDQADASPVQRHMELQARGAGGYAQGALYSGPPAGAPI